MLKINSDDEKDKLYKSLIMNELLDNILEITILNDDGLTVSTITEDNIVSESMTLKQEICDSENFRFGGCIASEFDIQLIDTEEKTFSNDLVGKKIVVKLSQVYPLEFYPSTDLYPSVDLYPGYHKLTQTWRLFVGTIDSAKIDDGNKHIHNIVAYDPIAKLYQSNVSNNLYNASTKDKATIRDLLSLCLESSEYSAEDFNLSSEYQYRNYYWEAEKQKNPNGIKITKGELLNDICDVSCGFGFFRPSEAKLRLLNCNDSIHGTEKYDFYESLTTDEKSTSGFDGLFFPYAGKIEDKNNGGDWKNETGILSQNGLVVGEDPDESENYYDYSDNILAWDYSSDNSGSNLIKAYVLYNNLNDNLSTELDYVPITAVVEGRLWVEVGDTIIINEPETDLNGDFIYDNEGNQVFTKVKSRVLSRTLTGIKALTDSIEAK